MKTKHKKHSSKSGDKKSSKKSKKAERAAKRVARKGDGSFPDLVVVTKEETANGEPYFVAHDGSTLATLFEDGETVGVYKLRRVSTVAIHRKIVR